MLGNHLILNFSLGTLAANRTCRWKAPFDCHIKQIDAVASNDSDATLKVGTTADDDKFLAAYAIGDSEVPVTKTVSNFLSTGETGKLSKGDVLLLTIDFDGSSGTAGQMVDIGITLTEG